MSSEPVVVLPPYWFTPDAPDHVQLTARIENLVKMREQINEEILYLRSIISKHGAKLNIHPSDAV